MAKVEDLAKELSRRGEPVVFLGDGADACRDILESKVTVPFAFAPVPSNRQRGASVAALGEQMALRGEAVSAAEFRPDYLRKSQAERERDVAERQGELEKLAAGVVVHEHD
jgi:tRNA threonylcarbamoyladenosine biosynthesis protein TsaB